MSVGSWRASKVCARFERLRLAVESGRSSCFLKAAFRTDADVPDLRSFYPSIAKEKALAPISDQRHKVGRGVQRSSPRISGVDQPGWGEG